MKKTKKDIIFEEISKLVKVETYEKKVELPIEQKRELAYTLIERFESEEDIDMPSVENLVAHVRSLINGSLRSDVRLNGGVKVTTINPGIRNKQAGSKPSGAELYELFNMILKRNEIQKEIMRLFSKRKRVIHKLNYSYIVGKIDYLTCFNSLAKAKTYLNKELEMYRSRKGFISCECIKWSYFKSAPDETWQIKETSLGIELDFNVVFKRINKGDTDALNNKELIKVEKEIEAAKKKRRALTKRTHKRRTYLANKLRTQIDMNYQDVIISVRVSEGYTEKIMNEERCKRKEYSLKEIQEFVAEYTMLK